MALKNRFTKGTKGYNGEVFVVPAVAAASAADIEAFAALTTPLGQLGVFDAETNELVTTALEEGQEFYVAQLRTNQNSTGGVEVKRSSPYIYHKKGIFALDYVAPVKEVKTVTLPGYTPAAGDEISIKVIETADQSHVPPTFTFTYKVKAADTLQKIYEGLRDAVLNHPEAAGTGDDLFVTATASAAGLVLTHKFNQASFRVATPGLSFDYAVVANTTPAVYGSGFYDEIAQLEYEGEVFDGVTTQYPGDGLVPTDFGTTQRFAAEGVQYGKIQVNTYKHEYSPTPVNRHHHLKHLVLAVVQGGAAQTQLETVFGLAEPAG